MKIKFTSVLLLQPKPYNNLYILQFNQTLSSPAVPNLPRKHRFDNILPPEIQSSFKNLNSIPDS